MTSLTAAPTTAQRPSRTLHIALWCVQVLLAAMFGMAGVIKSLQPMPALAIQIPWTAVVGELLTRFIGVSEFVGALGLILPAATRIRPRLTALAAAGLTVVMVLAAGYHLARGEFQALPINFVLGSLAGFIAWGRLLKAPISSRQPSDT